MIHLRRRHYRFGQVYYRLVSHRTVQRYGITARFLLEGPTAEEPEHPLRVTTELPHPNGVWLDVTIQQYIERSLQKWRTFTIEAQQAATVTACDGLLFYGNMTDLMLMNAPTQVLRGYIAQIIEIISGLNPVVIYFSHPDIVHALRKICDARGGEWEEYQVSWKVLSPYGVERSLSGFDGLVQLYQSYCALCDEIFAQLALPKFAIHNEGDWAGIIATFLVFYNYCSFH